MKIAVLYFCAGPYEIFWNDFSASARQHFCKGHNVHYYLFTDSQALAKAEDSTIVFQQNLGWPFISLYRYRIFGRIAGELADYDRVVFFNANCLFVEDVAFEAFFGQEKKLVACLHPAFHDCAQHLLPYESRPESTACVQNGKIYVQGALMGGETSRFLEVCEHLSQQIENDLHRGILARWFDESHWNSYINNHYDEITDILQVLTPSYLHPEDWDLPFTPLIRLRDKNKILDIPTIKGGITVSHGTGTSPQGVLQKVVTKAKLLVKRIITQHH